MDLTNFYKQNLSEMLSEEENYIDMGEENKDGEVIKMLRNK